MGVTDAKTQTKLLTSEALLELGDSGRCALIDGRVVKLNPMGGDHGFIEFNLGSELRAFVREHKLGWVTGGEVGIYTRRNRIAFGGQTSPLFPTKHRPNVPKDSWKLPRI